MALDSDDYTSAFSDENAEHAVRFGDVTVHRVLEWVGDVASASSTFPDTAASTFHEHEALLSPDFWTRATNAYRASVQSWVVRGAGVTIIIDTGVGNDRDRPQVPMFSHLRTDFMERLARAGVTREDVDFVVNTHIHYDHVGWNTHNVGGAWVPTFPNATYVVPRKDYDYFHPDNAARMRSPQTEDEARRFAGIRRVFEDSILPIERQGQLLTWSDVYSLRSLIHLEPTPGHTPGSSIAWLGGGGARDAVFVGDLVHSPHQILHPEHCCSFDLDREEARVSRRRVLEKAVARGAMVFPAHFAGRAAARVALGNAGLSIVSWAPLSRA